MVVYEDVYGALTLRVNLQESTGLAAQKNQELVRARLKATIVNMKLKNVFGHLANSQLISDRFVVG